MITVKPLFDTRMLFQLKSNKEMKNLPLFTIGVVSELLNVHPETLRVWERYGVVKPQRKNNRRFYSESDLKRLKFIQKLITEGLNLPGVRHYLKFYPCWQLNDCPACMHSSVTNGCKSDKPCWKEEGAYCQLNGDKHLCSDCEFHRQSAYYQAR